MKRMLRKRKWEVGFYLFYRGVILKFKFEGEELGGKFFGRRLVVVGIWVFLMRLSSWGLNILVMVLNLVDVF